MAISQDFYQEISQRLFMVDEHTYGEHYDPESSHSAWTAITAAFPHIIPLNIITDSFDYTIPRRLKEKIYAIGGGKHPAMIVDTVQDPQEISFETKMQHPLFMAYAVGDSADTTGAQAEVTVITFATVTDSAAQGKYFLINSIDASGEDHWAFWVSVVGDDTGKPTIEGLATANIYKMDLSGAVDPTNPTGAELATAFTTSADAADAYFGTPATTSAAVRTVTGVSNGAIRDCRDSGVDPLGITVSITTQGATKHTITESTGYAMPSFTFHIEQRNVAYSGSAYLEDVIIDLFGCVVTDCEITVDYADKIVKEAVTFKSPHYAIGNRLTNPPSFIEYIEPYTWAQYTEAASNYLLMEGTTDKTPEIVTKTSLKVTNDVEFLPGIGVNYATTVINKKRDVSLNIIGFESDKDALDFFLDTWDDVGQRYDTPSGKLNTVFKMTRTTTYDLFEIHVYNWLIEEYNNHLFNIDEGIKGVDVTLTDAVPYTDKRIIVTAAGNAGFIITDYLSDTCYQNSFS